MDLVKLVSIGNGEPITNSMLVAQKFNKRHGDVLRAIKNLECSAEFTKRNFAFCTKINDLQNGKPQPFVEMTKDGFVFLVMGFTGKEAAKFKEDYINEFNAMADYINGKATSLSHQLEKKQRTLHIEKSNASLGGSTLARWKKIKRVLNDDITKILKEMQPYLPFVEFESKRV